MPISNADAISFRALIPSVLSLLTLDDGSQIGVRQGKTGYPVIIGILLRSPIVGPLITAVIDSVVGGKAKDQASVLAAVQGAIAKSGMDLGTFLQRLVVEAPDTVLELIIVGAQKHLTFAEGEKLDDFIEFLKALGPDAHVALLTDWFKLNFPGGAAPFVAAFGKFLPKAAAAAPAQDQAPSADMQASGTPSTGQPTNSAGPDTVTAG